MAFRLKNCRPSAALRYARAGSTVSVINQVLTAVFVSVAARADHRRWRYRRQAGQARQRVHIWTSSGLPVLRLAMK